MQKIVLTIFFILAASLNVFAICDCFEILSHRKEFRKSKAVFVGEVIKIEDPKVEGREDLPDNFLSGYRITLKVARTWKGSKSEVVIWTDGTHELCAKWKFKVGEKYLVYARKVEGILIGAEFCSRTRPVKSTNSEQLKEFEELNKL
jgi:hypothetical protein